MLGPVVFLTLARAVWDQKTAWVAVQVFFSEYSTFIKSLYNTNMTRESWTRHGSTWASAMLPNTKTDWTEAKKVPPLSAAAPAICEQMLRSVLAAHNQAAGCSSAQTLLQPLIHSKENNRTRISEDNIKAGQGHIWSMNDLKVLRHLGHQLKHLLTPPLLSLHCPSVNNSSCPKAGGGVAFAF